jgi:hypothetical protein
MNNFERITIGWCGETRTPSKPLAERIIMQEHMSILRRVGKVLIAIGLVDIAVMIYCIVNGISYSSSLNIFAVIAGIFLFRGSLRAVAIVSWFGVFLISGLVGLVLLWPFFQPIELTFLRFKLNPISFCTSLTIGVFVLGLIYWVVHELRREPILAARIQAGAKPSSPLVPAIVGVVLVVALVIGLKIMLNGETAQQVKIRAEKELGQGYKFNVNAINIMHNSQGKFVSATVTAYNDKENRVIPVQWEEK